jgi:hypothetical protein
MLSVTPGAALGVPITGGQYVAHEPVHLEVVDVSRANQYSVFPWALVSTVPMLVLRVPITVVDDAAVLVVALLLGVLLVVGLDVLLLAGGVELPHAASTAAAPARTGAAHHRLRITSPFLADLETFPPDYVDPTRNVHVHSRWQSRYAQPTAKWRHNQASDIG